MADPNQFLWTHQKLLGLMVKDAGIHEGKWQLVVQYGMGSLNFGPTPEQANPGMVVAVAGIGIQKLKPEEPLPPPGLFVDAAEVNPEPKKPSPERRRQKA